MPTVIDWVKQGKLFHGYHLERYSAKFEAFGWHTIIIDGHDMNQVMTALDKARQEKHPTIILAKTIKGYGITEVENKNGYHGKAFAQQDMDSILKELDQRFADEASYKSDFDWKPHIPQKTSAVPESCVGVAVHDPE